MMEKEVMDIMIVLYDEVKIMWSYLESERHEVKLEANIETAKHMLLKKKYSLE